MLLLLSKHGKCLSETWVHTWVWSQVRGSSLALRFLRLRRAGDGLEKRTPSEDSGLWLPSLLLELLLEVELEQESAGCMPRCDRGEWEERGKGASSEEEGGWQAHWKVAPPPPPPPPPYPLPRRVLSFASSESVRGLRPKGEADTREKLDEGSGQPRWCEQGLVLQWLSLSEVRLASEDSRPKQRGGVAGLRGRRWGLQGLWPNRRDVHWRGKAGFFVLFSSNIDIQVGDMPSWLRSSSSCILRAKMSDTVLLRSSDDSITAERSSRCQPVIVVEEVILCNWT